MLKFDTVFSTTESVRADSWWTERPRMTSAVRVRCHGGLWRGGGGAKTRLVEHKLMWTHFNTTPAVKADTSCCSTTELQGAAAPPGLNQIPSRTSDVGLTLGARCWGLNLYIMSDRRCCWTCWCSFYIRREKNEEVTSSQKMFKFRLRCNMGAYEGADWQPGLILINCVERKLL